MAGTFPCGCGGGIDRFLDFKDSVSKSFALVSTTTATNDSSKGFSNTLLSTLIAHAQLKSTFGYVLQYMLLGYDYGSIVAGRGPICCR